MDVELRSDVSWAAVAAVAIVLILCVTILASQALDLARTHAPQPVQRVNGLLCVQTDSTLLGQPLWSCA